MEKKLYRCFVCNDVHYGNSAPECCPTCMVENAYVEIDIKEAAFILGLDKGDVNTMTQDELKQIWRDFTDKNDFKLNNDVKHVDLVAQGVLQNESQFGGKFCPCRLRDGSKERDLVLLCPCNFKVQDKWKQQGECWCGLFVKQ